ncbi:carboxymuconolactone decarboxylase family protein [Chitinophaga vietnamensis]|uniref:carboxymuconolactone decarboxylase family protein n=1 Tax=Chitinophaga vietnamensis TaxID=2593957 RepID=UPI00117771A8|nr:carboxymuconolactone decarboxylase family protein [Chitinophaga vietnamensis]
MEQRITYSEANKGLMDGMMKTEQYLKRTTLERRLLEMVSYRVSQLNGCAFCLDAHHKEAMALGEEEQRLYSLIVWRECPYYTERERAVLAYAEALTHVGKQGIAQELYNELATHFSKAEIADLTLAISQVNAWNRINIAFGTTPGKHVVGAFN